MNHGPAFQALWKKLRNDVRELQAKGYYGDGGSSARPRQVCLTGTRRLLVVRQPPLGLGQSGRPRLRLR